MSPNKKYPGTSLGGDTEDAATSGYTESDNFYNEPDASAASNSDEEAFEMAETQSAETSENTEDYIPEENLEADPELETGEGTENDGQASEVLEKTFFQKNVTNIAIAALVVFGGGLFYLRMGDEIRSMFASDAPTNSITPLSLPVGQTPSTAAPPPSYAAPPAPSLSSPPETNSPQITPPAPSAETSSSSGHAFLGEGSPAPLESNNPAITTQLPSGPLNSNPIATGTSAGNSNLSGGVNNIPANTPPPASVSSLPTSQNASGTSSPVSPNPGTETSSPIANGNNLLLSENTNSQPTSAANPLGTSLTSAPQSSPAPTVSSPTPSGTEVKALENRIEQLETSLNALTATTTQLAENLKALQATPLATPTPPSTPTASSPTATPSSTIAPSPQPDTTPHWVVMSATTEQAWVRLEGKNVQRRVAPGDILTGIGQIISIHKEGDHWVVEGMKGKIQ